ncbi:MAG: dihydrofolate reductase [Phycisphaerales bacterium]|nr:dihydrofolate reductase [Phycisphaerales bacterium]
MIQTIVVAASENNVIGIHNTLPWHLSDDLKFFKKITLGKPVLMGRKTFESLGSPLPKRLNIVLSRSAIELPEGVLHFTNYQEAILYLEQQETPEVCIIGGGVVFADTLSFVNQIYLTRVHTVLENGEIFFPILDCKQWTKVWEEYHPKDEQHQFDFSFQQYKRNQSLV